VNSKKAGHYKQGASQRDHCKQYFCVSFKYGYINLDTLFKLPATEETWWKKKKTTKYQTAELVHMELLWPHQLCL